MKQENKFESKKLQRLAMRVWFLENELYSDGSNVSEWLPALKKQLSKVFGISELP